MNNKQRESAAKYAYDMSKAIAVAALATAVTSGPSEQLLQLVVAAAGVYFIGWRFEQ